MTTILVMAKSPQPGKVKTRLCPPCTPEQAAQLAGAALTDTLAAVAASSAQRRVIALDGPPGGFIPAGFDIVPQCSGSFNHRLAHAWSTTSGPTVQIGMDTPQVTGELLDSSFEALLAGGARRAVLGCAEDGGWWALGLHEPLPDCFAGVPMSAPSTGEAQRRRIESLGLHVDDLEVLRDVDLFDDAIHVAALAPETEFARCLRQVTVTTERFTTVGGTR